MRITPLWPIDAPVPVLIYNYPAVTGVNITAETLGRLSTHPNIVGMKETGNDTAQVADFRGCGLRDVAVIAGVRADVLLVALCGGERRHSGRRVCRARTVCRAAAAFRAGRHREARELQRQLTPLAKLVTTVQACPGSRRRWTSRATRAAKHGAARSAVRRRSAEIDASWPRCNP